MSRFLLIAAISPLVTSCSPTITNEQMICEETGKVVSDREHVISALDRHFEADEILRKEFPAGTEPGHYSQLSYGVNATQNAEAPARISEDVVKPPFVPAHFRSFKMRAQRADPTANKIKIITDYLAQYPNCCRALSPRWLREGGWSENINYAPFNQSGSPNRWIKDVWVIDGDIENADFIWLDESEYRTANLDQNKDLKEFLFNEIFQKGDTASTQCGEAYFVNR